MGPLIIQGLISPEWNFIIAFFIGIGFGVALEQGGFSSSRRLAGVFYGYDMVVLRVFMTAVLTASVGLFIFNYIGWIDTELVFVNPTFLWSAIVGGAFIGLGIILGGFCPGTSFVAASIGKIDAMAYIGGTVVGVFLFAEIFPLIEEFYKSGSLGKIKIFDTLGMKAGVFLFIFIVMALIIYYVSAVLEKKYAHRRRE